MIYTSTTDIIYYVVIITLVSLRKPYVIRG